MKDFGIKDSGNLTKKRKNKKLQEEAVKKIKETKRVEPEDYLKVSQDKQSLKEVEPELAIAKEENHLGVPNSFYELTIDEQSMLMLYLSNDFISPLTGKRTGMNILESYIATHLDESEVEKIWELTYDGDGNVTGIKKIKNSRKFAQIKADAMNAFHKNPKLLEAWNDMSKMALGADPKQMLENAILQDALYSEKYQDKNANRRFALDIFNIGNENEGGQTLNIFLEGGGKELAEIHKDDEFVTTEDDLDVDD